MKPPYLYAGAALLAFGTGWWTHGALIYRPHLAADQRAALAASTKARTTEQAGVKIATQVRDKLDTQQETIRYVTRETLRAIPVYLAGRAGASGRPGGGVPGDGPQCHAAAEGGGVDSPDVSLPVGFGRLHDYAALGVDPPVPAPSGEPLSDPSGIGLPQLAETLADNYGVCHSDRAEVMAWRAWYVEQKRVWEGR